jgi:hypothetical protein
MNKKGFAAILILGLFAIVIVAVGTGWYFAAHHNVALAPVACTQEAKQCPDGSYVGRTGPSCEFAACPSSAQPSSTRVNCPCWDSARNICLPQASCE